MTLGNKITDSFLISVSVCAVMRQVVSSRQFLGAEKGVIFQLKGR